MAKKAPAAKSKPAPKKATPAQLRSELERTDVELVKLMHQRTQLATEISALKDGNGHPAMNLPREDDWLAKLIETQAGVLPAANTRAIFRELFSAARTLHKTLRVAYLGPEYSYSHLATIERFGHTTHMVPVLSIGAVFESVNRGDVDCGLVPLENSTDGRIIDTLEMFTRLPVRICGEVQLPIHHNLLAKCPRGEIQQVYSRPQALSQCRDWLAKHLPSARPIPITSTAAAAELARDRPNTAAIASREAGVHYGLDVLAENIEDQIGNTTRFAIIGHDFSPPTGRDKTAVVFQVPHKPGTLADAMGIFKKNELNLTWIESFPIPGRFDGYLFFVEFEGHESEPGPQKAIDALQKRASRLEVLGSYAMNPFRDDEKA